MQFAGLIDLATLKNPVEVLMMTNDFLTNNYCEGVVKYCRYRLEVPETFEVLLEEVKID